MSQLPTTFKVEIEFTAGVWTDVFADVLAKPRVRVRYWRTSEFSRPQIATANFTLNNKSGAYTAKNAASAYFPNVVPRKRLRITYAAGTAAVFFGYVRAFTPRLQDGILPVVEVEAVDRITYLQKRAFESLPAEQILSTAPSYYLPLSDPVGSTTVATYDGAHKFRLSRAGTGIAYNPITFGTASAAAWDESTWATFTGYSGGISGQVAAVPLVNGPDWSVAFSFRTTASLTNRLNLWYQAGEYGGAASYCYVSSAGIGGAVATSYAAEQVFGTTPANPNDGKVHTVVITSSSVTGIAFYVDGVGYSVTATPAHPPATWASIGGMIHATAPTGTTGYFYTGDMAHFAVWLARAISPAEVANIDRAIRDGFVGDTTGVRIDRFASWCGLTAADLSTADGQEHCSPQRTKGRNLVDLWDELVTTEGGGAALYVGTDGKIRFDDRSWRTPHANPVVTIDASVDIRPGDWAPFFDDYVFATDSTVTTAHGPTANYRDPTAVDVVTDSASTQALSATAARLLAAYRVNSSDAGVRFPQLRVNAAAMPAATAATFYAALPSITIGSRVRVSNIPKTLTLPGGTSARIFHTGSIDLYVEGWEIEYGPDEFSVTWDVSPADSPARAVWDDTTYGHWQAPDGSMSLGGSIPASSSGSTTSTTLVTIAGNPTLTTAAGNYPLKVKIGEEVCRIDAPPVGAASANILTAEDASFESGTAGSWVAGANCSVANSATRAHAGTKSLLITSTAAGALNVNTGYAYTTGYGAVLTLTGWLWCAAARSTQVGFNLYDSNRVLVAQVLGTASNLTASTWTQYTATTTVPWGVYYANLAVYVTSGAAAEQIWLDDLSLTQRRNDLSPQAVTLVRGQDGTFADAHAAGADVQLYPTATWVL